MADPVVSYYEEDNIVELNISNPEDFGDVIMGHSSDPQVIHIWNDKGSGAGSTPMYNTRIKIVTETGLDSGDTLENGREVVQNKWIDGKSITNEDVSYTELGGVTTLALGTINANSFHAIELIENVPSDATSVPPNGDIAFKLYVLYDLTAE
ncbi:hypothetical protein [Methanobacterium spitsbergense]|uniref:Uncharacterized protein n=1 Tax=Methanobacterium spitsbergense TaxID=2874285 RepID=A0A8T5UZY2_9EURY|nr:hypothetical protein [Methanobacterium spitsbergense]MBZ2166289.1 hypothetical protein [Methanobacterium spitsbergense]